VGLWTLGVNPTTLLAGVGVASVIIGLALQDSLGNLAAGVFILIYRPYDEDDVVHAGGVTGRVKSMGLANTTIVTFDNRRLFIPNRKVWSDVIENRSSESTRRVETTVRISYKEDVDAAFNVIRKTLDEHELVLPDPQPTIFVSKLADSWVEIAVWPWASIDNWWTLTIDLPRAVRQGLEKGGVEIPYPRQEIELAQGESQTDEDKPKPPPA
jgi:small conductance mechanosensitive channel